jgi:hypothetical protein
MGLMFVKLRPLSPRKMPIAPSFIRLLLSGRGSGNLFHRYSTRVRAIQLPCKDHFPPLIGASLTNLVPLFLWHCKMRVIVFWLQSVTIVQYYFIFWGCFVHFQWKIPREQGLRVNFRPSSMRVWCGHRVTDFLLRKKIRPEFEKINNKAGVNPLRLQLWIVLVTFSSVSYRDIRNITHHFPLWTLTFFVAILYDSVLYHILMLHFTLLNS